MAGLALVLAGPLVAEQGSMSDAALEPAALARVVTGEPLPHECLAPVVIDRIDGEHRALPSRGFRIEAGLHGLNGRALLDTQQCWPLDADQRVPTAADLSMEFVAGRVYHLAYDRSHPDAGEWRLVVWKVEAEPVIEAGDLPSAEPVQ